MRYIKAYEVITLKPNDNITPNDFIMLSYYWRYKNDMVDCIMRLEKHSTGKYPDEVKFIFKILSLSDSTVVKAMKANTFHEQEFDLDGMWTIIRLDIPGKILRTATEEEIEKFKFLEETTKYNL